MYLLTVRDHFDSAHYIKKYQGVCKRLHGHGWAIEIVLKGEKLNDCNLVVDFKDIKACLKNIFETHLDHCILNDTLEEENVSAEFISKWVYDNLKPIIVVNTDVELVSITIWESPDCGATYYE